jgi:hypothetical protein
MILPVTAEVLRDLEDTLAELHKARQMYTGKRKEALAEKIARLDALYSALKDYFLEGRLQHWANETT